MQIHSSKRKLPYEMTAPCLPNGRPVGKIIDEGGTLVWERRVKPKHLLRCRDAWTLNEPLFEQLLRLGIEVIRYRAPEGVYEVSMEEFKEHCDTLLGFAYGETVYAVKRSFWHFTPKDVQELALFEQEPVLISSEGGDPS